MYAKKVISRSERWGSVFHPSRYLLRPNYQDHACSQSLNRTTLTENFSSYIEARRYLSEVFSSRAIAPGISYTGLQGRNAASQLRFYSTYPKKEEKETGGNRLNEQIEVQFVRLVTEEGHMVVSRHEALERARKLKLDLVEVQRHADPPVCKLMDFHKEQYKKQLKEKDRAKSKTEVTLKADCKEIRFSGKIEQKDLKMKADTAIRLMERGYRVKCMILPKGKDVDAQELLSRFTDMVEDASVVESGPIIVEKKQEKKIGKKYEEDPGEKREIKHAYVILRHVKFGSTKKGGAKKSKAAVDTSPQLEKVAAEQPAAVSSTAIFEEDPTELGLETEDDELDLPTPQIKMRGGFLEGQKAAWPVFNSNDNFSQVIDAAKISTSNSANVGTNAAPETAASPKNFNVTDFMHPKPVLDATRAGTSSPSPPDSSLRTENRYRRSEPRNQFTPAKPMENRRSDMMDSTRLEPQFPNQRRQPPLNMNVSRPVGEMNQTGNVSVPRISNVPANGRPQQEPPRPDTHGTPGSSYGVFSTSFMNGPGKQGVAADAYKNGETNNKYQSARSPATPGNQNFTGVKSSNGQRPGVNDGGPGKFGIFSRENSCVTPNRTPKAN